MWTSASLSEQAIDRRAKASVLYHKMSDPSNPMSVENMVHGLRAYLDTSRSEALEVIKYLLDMVVAVQAKESSAEASVDWVALEEALTRLAQSS
ncbi:hypothetical protein BGZ99_008454 [Dissophora globulifera]|uniref:Uncharacterized protein n=1 Tax=Dissophora globulifera TaxID=979702 RepID=A0A9P6RBA1_9FUNG|nr:hypothetical protein BGZ99_008454 [Dissophora globulifera]